MCTDLDNSQLRCLVCVCEFAKAYLSTRILPDLPCGGMVNFLSYIRK